MARRDRGTNRLGRAGELDEGPGGSSVEVEGATAVGVGPHGINRCPLLQKPGVLPTAVALVIGELSSRDPLFGQSR
jgi:hypothetical protein